MNTDLDKYLPFADQPTPKPQEGTWILVAPDGREFTGESPIKCVHAEIGERVPPEVALGRIARSINEPDDLAATPPEPLDQPAEPLTGDVAWLWTHCRAIGMTKKSLSGSMRDDICLFTIDLKDALDADRPAARAEMIRQLKHYTICHLMNFPSCGAPTEAEIDAALRSDPVAATPDERAAFEKWILGCGYDSEDLRRSILPETYTHDGVHNRWQAWQARAALAVAAIPASGDGPGSIDHAFRCGFIDGQIQMRDEYADLRRAVEAILDAGHMNTEDLARLRAASGDAAPKSSGLGTVRGYKASDDPIYTHAAHQVDAASPLPAAALGRPTLAELERRLGDWPTPEVSGKS